MKNSHPRLYKFFFLLIAAVIPALLWANILTGPGISQNTNTILTSDLNGQYISYLVYFRNALLSGKNITYSFSSLLGNGTVPLIGYYLMSPLNFIVLLFPADQAARAVYWILLIKAALAGAGSAWLFGRHNDWRYSALLFSTTYALSGYTMAYFMHLMWMDTVVLLPAAAIGIEKLFEEKKTLFYTIALAINLAICYYTGYMAAGFCLLYFVFLLFEKKRDRKERLNLAGRYVLGTGLAGMVAGVILVPVLLGQAGANAGIHSNETVSISLPAVLSGFFTGRASEEEFFNGVPHLYIGMMMLYLVVLWFLPAKSGRRQSIVSGLIVLLFIISMMYGRLDLVWHLFSVPHSFPYRYAFAFILFLLLLAERSLNERVPQMTAVRGLFSAGIITGMAVLAYVYDASFPAVYLIMDTAWTWILGGVLYFAHAQSQQKRRSAVTAAAFVQAVMLSINGFSWLAVHSYDDHSLEGYYDQYHTAVNTLQNDDGDLYRIEKTFFYSENDPMLLGYNGLSFYSSADKETSRNLLGKLGYSENYMWAGYGSGGSLSGDSFFGMKYLLSDKRIPDLDSSLVQQINDTYIYENPYALSFGFRAGEEVKDLKLNEDVFTAQEQLYSAVLGRKTSFFVCQSQDDAQVEVHQAAMERNDIDGFRLERTNAAQEGFVRIVFEARADGPQYLYLYDTNTAGAEISVNGGERQAYASAENHGILPLGTYQSGDRLTVDIYVGEKPLIFSRAEFASMDLSAFYDAAAAVRLQQWQVTEHTENHIEAQISTSKDGILMTTIPYDKGWKITIDGKKVTSDKAVNGLLCTELSAGKHQVSLTYDVPGLMPGLVLTAAGLLIVVLLAVKIKEKY